MPVDSVQQYNRKALFVLRENVRSLLAARKESQTALAQYCGHDKSWLNKFLNEGRGLQLSDLDKIAAFFGLDPYQLFQPGIGALTERRVVGERRTGRDRRIGHQNRLIANLQLELNKVPRFSAALPKGGSPYDPRAVPAPVVAILADAEQRIADYYAQQSGQQAASHRRKVSGAPRGTGSVRRSDPPTPK